MAELRRPSGRRSCSVERSLDLELSAIGLGLRAALIGQELTLRGHGRACRRLGNRTAALKRPDREQPTLGRHKPIALAANEFGT